MKGLLGRPAWDRDQVFGWPGVYVCVGLLCLLRRCIALEFGLVSLGLQCFLRLSSAGLIVVLIPGCVTRRKLQTPGNAEEHKRQETPTISPISPNDKPHRQSTKHCREGSPGDG